MVEVLESLLKLSRGDNRAVNRLFRPTFVGRLFENHQLPVSPHLLIFTTPYSSSGCHP
ncbi:hypothetical protein KCP71_10325 [Salmonella enterica subsp. enterica]|nr:hypothetical protein KCP71_10325 [Salmonella enterica subsp. enterica]